MTFSQALVGFVFAGISTGAAWAAVQKLLAIAATWAATRKDKAKGDVKVATVTAETQKLEAQAGAQNEETTGKVVAYAVKAAERSAVAAEATDLALQNERMVRLGLEQRRDAQDKAIEKLRLECEERDRECQARERACVERDRVQDEEIATQAGRLAAQDERIAHLELLGARLLEKLEGPRA